MIPDYMLVKCPKPDCFRRIKPWADHCCASCSVAAAGKYEIDKHSESCEQRHAERGDYREATPQLWTWR